MTNGPSAKKPDEKGTNVTWTLTLSDVAGREVLRQALDLEKGYLP